MKPQNDNLIREYFNSKPSIAMPDHLSKQIMEQILAPQNTALSKSAVWAFVVLVVLSIGAIIWMMVRRNYSIEWPSFDCLFQLATPIAAYWMAIFAFATALGICSHYLTRHLHS